MKHRTDHFLDMVMYALIGLAVLVALLLSVGGIVLLVGAVG